MLNQANLRMTRQRMVILEELRNVDTHPSADEVYAMVRKRLPGSAWERFTATWRSCPSQARSAGSIREAT